MRLPWHVLLLATSVPVQAADWWVINSQGGMAAVDFGDTSQLQRSGENVLVWIERHYREPDQGASIARIQFEIRCATNELRERQYVDYDASMKVLASGDNTANGWRAVAPETLGALDIAFACSTPAERLERFLRIDPRVDRLALADFYLDPRPIVQMPEK